MRKIAIFSITATSCLFIIFHLQFLPLPCIRDKAHAAAAVILEAPAPEIRKRGQKCHTEGDGDIYGLGVRIGLYLQWGAGFILRNLGSWERMFRVRAASNVLCSALVVAEAIEIVSGTALSTDYLLSYYLTIALFYTESYNLVYKQPHPGNHPVYKLYPDLALVFQNLYFAAYSLFGVWFWISGIHGTKKTSCLEQAAIVLTFDLYDSRWMHAAAAISFLSGLLFSLFFFMHLLKLAFKGLDNKYMMVPLRFFAGISADTREIDHRNRLRNSLRFEFASILRPGVSKIFQEDKERYSLATIAFECFHYTMIYLMGPLIAIISVERMISVNNLVTPGISGSSGQVIALLTGCISMTMAVWEMVDAAGGKKNDLEFPPSKSSSECQELSHEGNPEGNPQYLQSRNASSELRRMSCNF